MAWVAVNLPHELKGIIREHKCTRDTFLDAGGEHFDCRIDSIEHNQEILNGD